jgi:single-strand DNA-binding protein
MSDINVCTFTGRITRDAQLKVSSNNKSYCTFSIANNIGFGEYATTVFLECTIWGNRGESICSYLNKGQLVGVSGELKLGQWTGKDGTEKSSLQLNVQSVQLLGGKKKEASDNDSDVAF